MGILTNIIDQLSYQVIGHGLDFLDNKIITPMIQSGRDKEAMSYLNNVESQAKHVATYPQDNSAQGILQGIQTPGVMPGSQYNQIADQTIPAFMSPEGIGAISKADPWVRQAAFQAYNQWLQDNPQHLQTQLEQEQAKKLIDFNAGLGSDTYKQNQGGTDVARSIFAGGNLSQEQRNQASAIHAGEVAGAQAGARLPAQLFLKKTPGARAGGGGSGGGGQPFAGNTISIGEQSAAEKSFLKYPQYREPMRDISGNAITNKNTDQVIYQGNDRLPVVNEIFLNLMATTKNPNAAVLQKKAIAIETQQFNDRLKQQEQNMGIPGVNRLGISAPVTENPNPVPAQGEAQQKAVQQLPQNPYADMTPEQKRQELRRRGVPEDQIKKAIP